MCNCWALATAIAAWLANRSPIRSDSSLNAQAICAPGTSILCM